MNQVDLYLTRGKDQITYWHRNDNDRTRHLTVWYVRGQGSQRTHIYSMTDCNFKPGLTAKEEELDAGRCDFLFGWLA